MNLVKSSSLCLLLGAAALLTSCDVQYDTVSFHEVGAAPAGKTPLPSIEVDTRITAGMAGGMVKSNKPYTIRAYYLDDTITFASAEFTKITVTYADASVDPGIAALKLPIKVAGKNHESHNSVAGGAVVVKKSLMIMAEFPATVSRDEAFVLEIEGRFTKDDGTTLPFTMKRKFDFTRNRGTESWADFVSGC